MNISRNKNQITGIVARLSSEQTVRVETKVTRTHPLYKKQYTRSRFFTVHNPSAMLSIGDAVTIEPCRPISKTKHWTVVTV